MQLWAILPQLLSGRQPKRRQWSDRLVVPWMPSPWAENRRTIRRLARPAITARWSVFVFHPHKFTWFVGHRADQQRLRPVMRLVGTGHLALWTLHRRENLWNRGDRRGPKATAARHQRLHRDRNSGQRWLQSHPEWPSVTWMENHRHAWRILNYALPCGHGSKSFKIIPCNHQD